jgi:hypothetical protein
MTACAQTTAWLLLPAPHITLLPHRFHAIVTDVSPMRDRDFTESVTD